MTVATRESKLSVGFSIRIKLPIRQRAERAAKKLGSASLNAFIEEAIDEKSRRAIGAPTDGEHVGERFAKTG